MAKVHVFLRYHKPRGVLSTTLSSPHGLCITEALSAQQRAWLERETDGRFVVPVGRLDKDSTGLLLLTTDESATGPLLRPSVTGGGSPLRKVYLVETRRRVREAALEQLRRGVELRIRDWGRGAKAVTTLPCRIEREARERVLRFELREGKNRQIRKMLGSFGYDVSSLHRVAFGPIELGALSPGELSRLSEEEVKALLTINLV
jgi:pseudouridine synthase